jgi:acetyltransferase-like isoleucine patch superfamily enzyme
MIGDACIVNSSANVDHECVLGHGVHIAPGATLTGCVEVGDRSFIAAGAVVLPRIKIGSDSIIGAGSVVTRDIPDNVIAFGSPARIIRPNIIE